MTVSEGWHRASGCEAGTCVEVAFTKSSRSCEGACVEAAICSCYVRVRHSKDPAGPVLTFTREEWSAFVDGARDGEFNLE